MVRIEQDRIIDFHYLVQKVAQSKKVRLTIFRDGQPVAGRSTGWPGSGISGYALIFTEGSLPTSSLVRWPFPRQVESWLIQGMIKDFDTAYYLAHSAIP